MDIVGYRAHRRGEDKQQQGERQRLFTANAIAQRAEKQLPKAETNQRRRERQLGLRAGGAELLGDFRQRGQIEVGTQRPNGAKQTENHDPGERNSGHINGLLVIKPGVAARQKR